jgi:hypothetical protein
MKLLSAQAPQRAKRLSAQNGRGGARAGGWSALGQPSGTNVVAPTRSPLYSAGLATLERARGPAPVTLACLLTHYR